MLYTNLKHIENSETYTRIIHENVNVMIICGRMDPMCIPVYRIAEELEGEEYKHVKFYDMEFDNPESSVILTLPELSNLEGIPFTLYYKNGELLKVTSGQPTKIEVMAVLDQEFKTTVNVF